MQYYKILFMIKLDRLRRINGIICIWYRGDSKEGRREDKYVCFYLYIKLVGLNVFFYKINGP